MNAETLLKDIKSLLSCDYDFYNFEIIITPTKSDPTKIQNKVSFIMFEQVINGRIPRYKVSVEKLK